MSHASQKACWAVATAIGLLWGGTPCSYAQQQAAPSVTFKVRGAADRLEMTVNKSRVVEFPFEVPRMMVNNPDLVRVSPISSKSIQLSALKSGVTQLNVWDTEGNVTALDLIILGDVAELDMTLTNLFPEAALRLYPLNSSLYVSGFVPKADMVASILSVAAGSGNPGGATSPAGPPSPSVRSGIGTERCSVAGAGDPREACPQ